MTYMVGLVWWAVRYRLRNRRRVSLVKPQYGVERGFSDLKRVETQAAIVRRRSRRKTLGARRAMPKITRTEDMLFDSFLRAVESLRKAEELVARTAERKAVIIASLFEQGFHDREIVEELERRGYRVTRQRIHQLKVTGFWAKERDADENHGKNSA